MRCCRSKLGLWICLVVVVAIVGIRRGSESLLAADEKAAGPILAHNVYFSLKDRTPANVQKLVDGCHQYLSKHPGTVAYFAGTLADLNRPVNDRDWDVALVLIFENVAAHDTYQTSADHQKFLAEYEPLWDHVRVFDADVTTGTP